MAEFQRGLPTWVVIVTAVVARILFGVLFTVAIDAGRFPPLPDSGNCRSIVSVTNLIDAAVLAAMEPKANGQCYIVTDARAYSARALYEAITRALGRRVPHWSVPLSVLRVLARVGDGIGAIRGRRFVFDTDALAKLIESSWYSAAKITRELGYRPRVSLDEALPDLVTWYRATRR